MTRPHAAAPVRLLVLLALLACTFGLTTLAAPASPAAAASPTAVVHPAACSDSPAWVAGQWYNAGAIVKYSPNGQYYVATNANPGYDPTISTWYWSPYTCAGGGGGTTCATAQTWTAGQNYDVGAIVKYPANGQYYIATNANPGYDPTISTWYWSPYTCTGDGGGTTPHPADSSSARRSSTRCSRAGTPSTPTAA